MSKFASTPISCSSLLLILPTTGPKLHTQPTASYSSFGIVPVSPHLTGTFLKGPLNKFLKTSAFALCTSSTIIQTTLSKNSSIGKGVSPALVFFSNTAKLCQVQIVCCLSYCFLSPNNTSCGCKSQHVHINIVFFCLYN